MCPLGRPADRLGIESCCICIANIRVLQPDRPLVAPYGTFAAEMSSIEDTAPRPTAPKPKIDGRRLRSERTKQLIIEAYLALLRENPLIPVPTAADIAARAGYSVRSVFERFPDLHALRVAASDYGLAHAAALAPARDIDGDRATRIKSHVETGQGPANAASRCGGRCCSTSTRTMLSRFGSGWRANARSSAWNSCIARNCRPSRRPNAGIS